MRSWRPPRPRRHRPFLLSPRFPRGWRSLKSLPSGKLEFPTGSRGYDQNMAEHSWRTKRFCLTAFGLFVVFLRGSISERPIGGCLLFSSSSRSAKKREISEISSERSRRYVFSLAKGQSSRCSLFLSNRTKLFSYADSAAQKPPLRIRRVELALEWKGVNCSACGISTNASEFMRAIYLNTAIGMLICEM